MYKVIFIFSVVFFAQKSTAQKAILYPIVLDTHSPLLGDNSTQPTNQRGITVTALSGYSTIQERDVAIADVVNIIYRQL